MTTIVVSVNNSWNLLNFRADLLRRLVGDGFDVVALTPNDEHAGRLAELGLKHVVVPIDSQGISPRRDATLMLHYWRVLKQIRPAAYLGWTIKPNIYGSLAAHALGIPVINNISGLGTAFIREGWLTRIVSALYRRSLSRSSTVFFQNTADRALFVDRALVRKEQTVILPGSGINTIHFKLAHQREATNPFTFLLIARLIRDKGVFEYVEAANQLRQQYPEVHCNILGQLDVINRTAITRAEVARWTATGVVNYLGQTDDVRTAIAEADCIVLPSYREGLPRSLLEGAAMGKPLIATAVPGCTDIARVGENAILCAPRDAASLVEAMQAMLLLDPAVRAAMGARSRTIVQQEFDVAIVEARYLDAIARAIDPLQIEVPGR